MPHTCSKQGCERGRARCPAPESDTSAPSASSWRPDWPPPPGRRPRRPRGLSCRGLCVGAASSKIAFISEPPAGGYCGIVYVMNADGSGPHRLAAGAPDECAQEVDPVWLPDGRKIAFVSSAKIYVANADGSGQRQLTPNVAWEGSPAWSPDGRRIAFARARPDPRRERRRERAAEADAQRCVGRLPSGLVAGRAEDRLCTSGWQQRGGLRRERRRQRPAETDAQQRA